MTASYLQRFGDAAKRGQLQGPVDDIAKVSKGFNALKENSLTNRRDQFQNWAALPLYPANWMAAKALTSEPTANYLAYGLLADRPALQSGLLMGGSPQVKA